MSESKSKRKWTKWLVSGIVFAILGMCVWSTIWLYTPKQGVVDSFNDAPDATFADLRHDGPIGFHSWKSYGGFGQNAICRTDESSIRKWVRDNGGTITEISAVSESLDEVIREWLPAKVLDEFGYVPATLSVGDLQFGVEFGDYWGASGYFDIETGQAFLRSGD